MVVEGETYESKTGVRFRVELIDHIEKKAVIEILDSGLGLVMELDDIEKSIRGAQ